VTPQRLTHPETFGGYTSAFRWSANTGLSRDLVALALRAEGIPVATGVGRLMSDNELFLRKLAYGRAGHPFSSVEYKGNVEYRAAKLPNAHRVHDHEYLAFFLCGWPNTPEDMDDIVTAIEKILAHRELLAQQAPAAPLLFNRGRQ
jgi:hypothetical protein